MVKKTSENKSRSRKKSLSAASETVTEIKNKPLLQDIIHFHTPFKCKTKNQKLLAQMIQEKEIIIASGAAGVGKTYVAIAVALELVKSTNTPFNKIIITKPAVEAEEEHGFLPGDQREKMEPFVASILDVFDKLIGKSNRMALETNGYLEIMALAYVRGKSIDNAIFILDEAQNISPNQMKTVLTRIGDSSKFVITGDLDQSDRYRNVSESGLYDAINKHKNIPEIGFIAFSNEDIVRNKLISKILDNYKRTDETQETRNPVKIIRKKATFFAKIKKWWKNFIR